MLQRAGAPGAGTVGGDGRVLGRDEGTGRDVAGARGEERGAHVGEAQGALKRLRLRQLVLGVDDEVVRALQQGAGPGRRSARVRAACPVAAGAIGQGWRNNSTRREGRTPRSAGRPSARALKASIQSLSSGPEVAAPLKSSTVSGGRWWIRMRLRETRCASVTLRERRAEGSSMRAPPACRAAPACSAQSESSSQASKERP